MAAAKSSVLMLGSRSRESKPAEAESASTLDLAWRSTGTVKWHVVKGAVGVGISTGKVDFAEVVTAKPFAQALQEARGNSGSILHLTVSCLEPCP